MNALAVIPQANVTVRDATLDDVPFIDALQKIHRKQIGFMHEATLVSKINARETLVAQDAGGTPVGYCIGTDRYNKHDNVGIVYHLNVSPGKQRGYIGMALLKAMFDRAAYGCRLFCCWCAQDIDANRFWESMGFVPLAFRTGSEKKSRVHIFWQKRIREGDTTTPWWFPSETGGGAIRENRLVLPIPPGKHWSDEMPIVLPRSDAPRALPAPRAKAKKPAVPVKPPSLRMMGGLRHAVSAPPQAAKAKRERVPKVKRVNDPKLVAAARELKDRWLEHVNSGGALIESAGKYDVTRALPAMSAVELPAPPQVEVGFGRPKSLPLAA